MKIAVYIYLSFTLCLFGLVNKENPNPNKIFKKHIKVIELLFSGKTVPDLDTSVLFLEDLTGIKSDIEQGFVHFYAPTDQNLKDWKDWYKKNKKRLYWDEKEQKVKVRELKKTHR